MAIANTGKPRGTLERGKQPLGRAEGYQNQSGGGSELLRYHTSMVFVFRLGDTYTRGAGVLGLEPDADGAIWFVPAHA